MLNKLKEKASQQQSCIMKVGIALCMLFIVGCASSPKVEEPKFNGIDQATQERVSAWKQMIEKGAHWSDVERLHSVNDFVNEVRFVDDIIHWQKEDYWATPLQTLVTKAGDCEDLSIAKYFTLTSMGMDENKLRLTYVKALSINKPHMVVSYYEEPNVEPLVLDNLNTVILPASQRRDLLPVYSFNGTGLWTTKRDQSGKYVGDSSRISLWKGLLQHMDVEAANEEAMICLYQYYDLPDARAKTFCP